MHCFSQNNICAFGPLFISAPCVSFVASAIEHIFPLVYEFRKERTKEEEAEMRAKQVRNGLRKRKHEESEEEEEEEVETEDEESGAEWVACDWTNFVHFRFQLG